MPLSIKRTLAAAMIAALAPALPVLADGTDGPGTSYISAELTLPAEDVIAIEQVIYRLNHALDAADYPLYASFFAEDGVFVSGFGNAVGPDAVAAALDQVSPFITNKRHIAGNVVISGAGDEAVATSYLVVFERETGLDYVGSAVNIDTLERRDGTWKVVRHDSHLDPATARAMQAIMDRQEN